MQNFITRTLQTFVLLAVASSFAHADNFMYFKKKAAAGGGGGASFSDNFDRTDSDSLGANWTEANGDLDIVTNTVRMMSSSWTKDVAVYTGAACSTVNQYVMATTVNGSVEYPGLIFRYTNASLPMYFIQFGGGNVEWYSRPTAGGSDTQIAIAALTVNSGDEIGVTITGTGASTVVRIWKNPTGLPTAADNWNGDSTPDVTFTDDPGANAVDTGNYVGVGGSANTGNSDGWDNFFGGDIP